MDSLPAERQGKPKNIGVGSLSLLQRIFPTREWNRGLLHCRWILYQLSCQGNPIKKSEHQSIDAFELWCWRRLFRDPWTAQRSNQSILKDVSPECSLEGLMLKLKLQYFGHLMRRADSLEKTLMLGKIEGRRRWGWQKIRWLDGSVTQWTWVWVNSRSWWWTGKPGMLQSMGSQRIGPDLVTKLNWTGLRGTLEAPPHSFPKGSTR